MQYGLLSSCDGKFTNTDTPGEMGETVIMVVDDDNDNAETDAGLCRGGVTVFEFGTRHVQSRM